MNNAYRFLKSNGLMIASLVGLILTIIFCSVMIAGVPDVSHLGTDIEKRQVLYPVSAFDPFLYVNEFLILFAFFVILPAAGILGIIRNPKSSVFGLIGIITLVVLFVVFYAISPGEITPSAVKMGLATGTVKIVDACIYTTYLFLAISIGVPAFMGIRGFIKNR